MDARRRSNACPEVCSRTVFVGLVSDTEFSNISRFIEGLAVVARREQGGIEVVVFEGLKRSEAAELVGLNDHAHRVQKPYFLAHLNKQIEVSETSGRRRVSHRAI